MIKPLVRISIESFQLTILSFIPCTITLGHLTYLTTLILLNLSSRNISAILPHNYLAICVTDLIGLIKIKQSGLYVAAKWHAGPEPIDLPLISMSL